MEEPHATPHDHPWSFETEILDGGYVEEVFHLDPSGGWHSELIHRLSGETYHIDAAHIHRIVELPTGECWTSFVQVPTRGKPGSGGSETGFSPGRGMGADGRASDKLSR